jgi:hypothetical protein
LKSTICGALLAATLLTGVPAQASSIITATFDSTIANDTNKVAIENAINSAIVQIQATFLNIPSVKIYFQEGGGLGGSEFFDYTVGYSTYYSGLVTNNANPAAIAGLAIDGSGSNNPVTGTANIDIKSANARAVGISILPGCLPTGSAGSKTCSFAAGNSSSVDGIITLNTSLTTPGSPGSTAAYFLIGVVEHEIDEILGLGSRLGNTMAASGTVTATNPAPEDLFRYNFAGQRIFSVNCAQSVNAYLSYSGASRIQQLNNACNNADFGDFASGVVAQVQDAFATQGANPTIGANEIAALSAIGYQTATAPEPSTVFLSMGALAGLYAARVRRSRTPAHSGVSGGISTQIQS